MPAVLSARLYDAVVEESNTLLYHHENVVPLRVSGISMQPTFKDGQRVYLWRLGPWSTPIQRSDIVAIRMAAGEHAGRLAPPDLPAAGGPHPAVVPQGLRARLDRAALAEVAWRHGRDT